MFVKTNEPQILKLNLFELVTPKKFAASYMWIPT